MLAKALILATIALGLFTTVALAGRSSAAAPTSDAAPPCLIFGARTDDTAGLALGAVSRVSLAAQALCKRRELVIVFGYIGGSGLLPRPRHAYAKPVADWLEDVEFRGALVGIVGRFRARVVQPLTDDRELLERAAFLAFDSEHDELVWHYMRKATDYLLAVRAAPRHPEPDQAILLLGHEMHDGSQARAVRESRRAQAAGIEVYTVGQGWLLRSLASSRAHSFEWRHRAGQESPAPQARAAAARALRVVDDTFYGLQPDTVTISDTLPVDIGYVPGSAGPGGTWDGAKRRVSWTIPQPGVVTHTRTFDIRPLACGHLALSEGGLAQAFIAGSVVASYAYPIPEADVPCPTATATTTPTPTATATSPATSTPTVNPTATRRPRPLYLPVALREPPCSAVRRTDVALVLDTSRSMLEATTGGRTKLEAAVAAAEAFLDLLALPEDQAAVVTFNGGVQVVASLTGDRAALSKAFGRIVPGSGTRIHLGIEAAKTQLTGPARRGENVPVMVVLTDGRASPDGPEVAVAAADRAKAAGILIFTIGLGADLDRGALRQMASRPEWFYEAPDAEELAGVYSAVAVAIPCPPGTYWGRRP